MQETRPSVSISTPRQPCKDAQRTRAPQKKKLPSARTRSSIVPNNVSSAIRTLASRQCHRSRQTCPPWCTQSRPRPTPCCFYHGRQQAICPRQGYKSDSRSPRRLCRTTEGTRSKPIMHVRTPPKKNFFFGGPHQLVTDTGNVLLP